MIPALILALAAIPVTGWLCWREGYRRGRFDECWERATGNARPR